MDLRTTRPMEQLTQEIVKEFLKGHGLSRTLRAFEASLITTSVSTGLASKKASKLDAPALAGTDDTVPRLDRMVRQIWLFLAVYFVNVAASCLSLYTSGIEGNCSEGKTPNGFRSGLQLCVRCLEGSEWQVRVSLPQIR